MVGFRAAVALLVVVPVPAAAEGNCTTVDIDFMPAELPITAACKAATSCINNQICVSDTRYTDCGPCPSGNPFTCPAGFHIDFEPQALSSQIVAWVELPNGMYKDTAFITQQTGTFGIGNRPGRLDFNSAPDWPYGRRAPFPVWAHRHGMSWLEVAFQNELESNLSHPFNQSSREPHFCRPRMQTEFDAITCASTVFTDKGVMKPNAPASLYPPRNDLARLPPDDPTVDMFGTLNPFDAVSGATPVAGAPATVSWAVPETVPFGDYVMFVEVAREFDWNATYNTTRFPPPTGVDFGDYGEPYRGQPSVVYRIPFSITDGSETTATTTDYIGYSDPDGADGTLRPPDATITADVPGSGATRLQLISASGTPYRIRVVARPQIDLEPPDVPSNAALVGIAATSATIAFVAPGDDGLTGRPQKYDIRYVASEVMNEERFATAIPVTANLIPGVAGTIQTFQIDGLLPDTQYSVGVRAIDDCRNESQLAIIRFFTSPRGQGSVDACFVATAAYGSVMANDVDMLRRFRDAMLRKSVLGELAVETYYTFSPAVANVVGESDLLRHTARGLLAPLVDRLRDGTVAWR